MATEYEGTLGQAIFDDIDSDVYLAELYDSLLFNYGLQRLALPVTQHRNVNVEDALRFADLLSKSTHPTKKEAHRVWAQEIATRCSLLYPEDPKTKFYATAVFTAVGNYQALKLFGADAYSGVLDELFNDYQADHRALEAKYQTVDDRRAQVAAAIKDRENRSRQAHQVHDYLRTQPPLAYTPEAWTTLVAQAEVSANGGITVRFKDEAGV